METKETFDKFLTVIIIISDKVEEQAESKGHALRVGIPAEDRRRVREHDERSHDDQDKVQPGPAGTEGGEGIWQGGEEGTEERDRHHRRDVRQVELARVTRRCGDTALHSGFAAQTGTSMKRKKPRCNLV